MKCFGVFRHGGCTRCVCAGVHSPAQRSVRSVLQCSWTVQGWGCTSGETWMRKGKTLLREPGTKCDKALPAPREDGEGRSPRYSSMDYLQPMKAIWWSRFLSAALVTPGQSMSFATLFCLHAVEERKWEWLAGCLAASQDQPTWVCKEDLIFVSPGDYLHWLWL